MTPQLTDSYLRPARLERTRLSRVGSATWGLANIEAGRGLTTTWIKPSQAADVVNGVAVNKYIDEFGNETASADGYTELSEWSPIFLDKGELTFNTSGNLVSPPEAHS